MLIDQILPDTHRVPAPRSSSSIISRYGSLAPDGRLTPGSGNVASGEKPSITSLAGFALSACLGPKKPVITSLAGFAASSPTESVGTELAALDGGFRPQTPGARSAILADVKFPPAVSRRTPVAASIRRKDQPRRPSAITCSCFAFSKTLPMPTEAKFPLPETMSQTVSLWVLRHI